MLSVFQNAAYLSSLPGGAKVEPCCPCWWGKQILEELWSSCNKCGSVPWDSSFPGAPHGMKARDAILFSGFAVQLRVMAAEAAESSYRAPVDDVLFFTYLLECRGLGSGAGSSLSASLSSKSEAGGWGGRTLGDLPEWGWGPTKAKLRM